MLKVRRRLQKVQTRLENSATIVQVGIWLFGLTEKESNAEAELFSFIPVAQEQCHGREEASFANTVAESGPVHSEKLGVPMQLTKTRAGHG